MKLTEGNRALTKRDVINKLAKVEKAFGTAIRRGRAQNSALLAEVIRLKPTLPAPA